MELKIAASAFVSASVDGSPISLPGLRRLGFGLIARPNQPPVLVAPDGHLFPLSEDGLGHFWLSLEVVPAECESANGAAADDSGPADEATDGERELARAAPALFSAAPIGASPGVGLADRLDERVVSGA